MRIYVRRYRGLSGLVLLGAAGAFAATGCGDEFSSCYETHTCPRGGSGGSEGGAEDGSAGEPAGAGSGDVGGSATETSGGEAQGGTSTGLGGISAGGEPPVVPEGCGDGIVQIGEECDDENDTSGDGCSETCTVDAPPAGAFAWYRATKDDVVVTTATLSDGNEFIKTYWVKTNMTATALQPDADGGNGATALYQQSTNGAASMMKHPLGSASHGALKTLRIRAKKGERQSIVLGGPANPGGLAPAATFDLLNGVVSNKYAVMDAKITPVKDLWYDCEVTFSGGNEYWLSVPAGPLTNKPVVWVQSAAVDQSTVSVWKDRVGSRDLTDPMGTWRWLASSPDFNGAPAVESNQQINDPLSAEAAEDWQFLHDGSGGSLVISLRLNVVSEAYGHSVGTQYTPGNGQGMSLGTSPAESEKWSYSASNEVGESVFSLSGGVTTGTRWLAGSYGSAQTPNAQLFDNGVMVVGAAASATPTTKPSTEPLRLGDTATAPSQKISEVVVYKRALSAADITQLKLYFDSQLPR